MKLQMRDPAVADNPSLGHLSFKMGVKYVKSSNLECTNLKTNM